ncbi:MAG: phosphatase PAP2 family protein [Actinomycetales bacterium]|nr:phosphatase PAP2 family protein [Actinomycetales bacterium]
MARTSTRPRTRLPRLPVSSVTSTAADLARQLAPGPGVVGSIVDRRELPLPRGTWAIFGAAFVGFAMPVIGFVEMAERVRGGAKLPFDKPVMLWLQRHHSPRNTAIMRAVTELGGVTAVPLVALTAAGYLAAVQRSRRPAALLTVSLVGSTIINSVLKIMYRRARPTFFTHIVNEKSYSFPSGHAMASAALAGCACVLAWPTPWRGRVIAASAVYVPSIGVTRMYLGVHFPSDVLAGWCVSLAWVGEVASIMWLMDRLDRSPRPMIRRRSHVVPVGHAAPVGRAVSGGSRGSGG